MRLHPVSFTRLPTSRSGAAAGVAAILLAATACSEIAAPRSARSPEDASLTTRVECIADVTMRSVSCMNTGEVALSRTALLPGSRRDGSLRATLVPPADSLIILGNQGGYVRLTSSNVTSASGVFSFDVTVMNLIAQTIGTTNGSISPTGIRVFFATGPMVTGGTGTVDFSDGVGGFYYDGVDTFTSTGQPYFQYTTMLATNATSSAKTWRLRFSPLVTSFAFTLYVSAPVRYPEGYVAGNPYVLTVNPSEAIPLGATMRDIVDRATGGTIAYVSLDPSVASVDASGVVTGGPSNGITYITLQSGNAPSLFTTAVNVCASTPTITSGASINGIISATDCYSGFASSDQRPDPSYLSDMYRIFLTAGQQVNISLAADMTFSPYLSLVNPSGEVEATAIDGGNNTATISAGSPIKRTGVYIIEASQQNLTLNGTYTLNVSVLP
ncbi:MAG: hypothetical protein ABIP93_02705 [Gemmatimonadaceae bacterium]